jgi:hypothetical protein
MLGTPMDERQYVALEDAIEYAETRAIPIEQIAAAMADPLVGPLVNAMLTVHVNDGSAHDRAMAWSEGHTAGYDEGVEAAAGPRDEITLDELVLRKWADLARRLIAVAPTSAVMDETGISAPHSTPPERQSIRAEADRIILRWLERDLALAKASE